MLVLKHKLTLGFTGMLTLLLMVGTFGIILLNQYSSTLEDIFKENFNSVVYGQQMKEAVDAMDDYAQQALYAEVLIDNSPVVTNLVRDFEIAQDAEAKNLTVRGEKEKFEELMARWNRYKHDYRSFFIEFKPDVRHRLLYQKDLRPLSFQLKTLSQDIITLNLTNILSVDGKVKESTLGAKRMMVLLLVSGVVLATGLILFSTRSILRPLQLVTESAREIQKGNLDLVLPIGTNDEIGQLAEAFNTMTAKLREFRRSNVAQLVRVQKTTQLALNSFPEAVAVVGLDGKIELANHLAVNRFNLLPGTDLVKHEHKILWSMFQETFATLAPVLSKGYEKAIQMFINGQEYFFLAQTVPIIDESKLLNGVTLVLIDVTNLRRIDESKSGMLSLVSHELKTPLTSIRMATHLLLDERMGALTPKQLELLLAARDDAERLHRIIENLLDMSRIESGSERIDLVPLSPEKMAREVSSQYLTSARDQGIAMVNNVSDQLPKVMADPSRIPHVFGNLITNALKHTTAGGRIELYATWNEGDNLVTFSVQNTGITIPEEYSAKIFERFFRMPGEKATDGVGLGLAIARDIVIGHGGRIWAEHAIGQEGARFSFTLNTSDSYQPLIS
ncbi:MAG: HAMP domain-containing protein [Chitinophagaceae bacterium]|nr:HAMP domain-containing protein [Oligoflexus sp.]